LVVLGVTALAAFTVGTSTRFLTPLVVAIGIGAIVANTVQLPGWAAEGVGTHSLLLETAIVLLGVSLSLDSLLAAGPLLVGTVVAVVAIGLAVVTVLARLASLGDRLGTLLAAGASICGVSAIAAVAPACDADESQIAHAAGTILLFDAVTLVAFPALGGVLPIESRLFGIWIGLSMFSTGPVTAAGFAHSATAGKWATITKLARNAFIGAVAVAYSIRYSNRTVRRSDQSWQRLWAEFPKFLVGFILLAIVTNAGLLSGATVDAISRTSDALFLVAFAGLGFDIRFDKMRSAGAVPLGVVGLYLLLVSAFTYLLVTLLF
jgi:uncharacterized integral membrane protein (TIGR00698 family)